jgi:hypothetical protein
MTRHTTQDEWMPGLFGNQFEAALQGAQGTGASELTLGKKADKIPVFQ